MTRAGNQVKARKHDERGHGERAGQRTHVRRIAGLSAQQQQRDESARIERRADDTDQRHKEAVMVGRLGGHDGLDQYVRLFDTPDWHDGGIRPRGNDRLRRAQQRQAAPDDSPERRNARLKRLRLHT